MWHNLWLIFEVRATVRAGVTHSHTAQLERSELISFLGCNVRMTNDPTETLSKYNASVKLYQLTSGGVCAAPWPPANWPSFRTSQRIKRQHYTESRRYIACICCEKNTEHFWFYWVSFAIYWSCKWRAFNNSRLKYFCCYLNKTGIIRLGFRT